MDEDPLLFLNGPDHVALDAEHVAALPWLESDGGENKLLLEGTIRKLVTFVQGSIVHI